MTDLLSLVCDVKFCFCHFSMWYPGSGVILDCIDSLIFAAFLTMKMKITCTSYSIKLGGISIEHTINPNNNVCKI